MREAEREKRKIVLRFLSGCLLIKGCLLHDNITGLEFGK
jgi:hypothetical protein